MNRRTKNLIWQCSLAIFLHTAFFWSYFKFDNEIKLFAGLQGDVSKKIGAANADHTPIKISTSTGGLEDARLVLEKRRQEARDAQAASDASKVVDKSEQQSPKSVDKNTKISDKEKEALEQERQKSLAVEKAKVLAEKKAKEEQEKAAAAAKVAEQNKKNKDKKAKTETSKKNSSATSASSAQAKQVQTKAQREKTKSQNAHRDLRNTSQSDAFDQINGEGGGDGAKVSDYSADNEQRYRQRVQAVVNRSFNARKATLPSGAICRIDITIGRNGRVKYSEVLESNNDNVCRVGFSILKDIQLPVPSDEIFDAVEHITLAFEVE